MIITLDDLFYSTAAKAMMLRFTLMYVGNYAEAIDDYVDNIIPKITE